MKFLKTTVIGGLVFLVPLVVLGLVIGEAIGVMLVIAEPMASFLPADSIGGVATANLIAVAIIALVCFAAGILARAEIARKLTSRAEAAVLNRIPGYVFLKGLTDTLSPHENADLKPALVSIGNVARIGLEVERVGEDRVAIYFPGSPNAWSGIVQIISVDHVKPIDVPLTRILDYAEQLGRGANDMLTAKSQTR